MSYNPNFSSISSIESAQALRVTETNTTGSLIPKLTPVKINTSGNLALIDVSIEADILALVGLTNADISNTAAGEVANTGRVKDITTGAAFGDTLYISKTGGITNIKPEIGVGGFIVGDFVVKLGVIAKNQLNPLNKDIILQISLIGQL
jgi:hypothetical protein